MSLDNYFINLGKKRKYGTSTTTQTTSTLTSIASNPSSLSIQSEPAPHDEIQHEIVQPIQPVEPLLIDQNASSSKLSAKVIPQVNEAITTSSITSTSTNIHSLHLFNELSNSPPNLFDNEETDNMFVEPTNLINEEFELLPDNFSTEQTDKQINQIKEKTIGWTPSRAVFIKRRQEYPWLSGSIDGAFCSLCKSVYSNIHIRSNGGTFVTVPFTNWKHSTGQSPNNNVLLQHQMSKMHKDAIEAHKTKTNLQNSGVGSISNLL